MFFYALNFRKTIFPLHCGDFSVSVRICSGCIVTEFNIQDFIHSCKGVQKWAVWGFKVICQIVRALASSNFCSAIFMVLYGCWSSSNYILISGSIKYGQVRAWPCKNLLVRRLSRSIMGHCLHVIDHDFVWATYTYRELRKSSCPSSPFFWPLCMEWSKKHCDPAKNVLEVKTYY